MPSSLVEIVLFSACDTKWVWSEYAVARNDFPGRKVGPSNGKRQIVDERAIDAKNGNDLRLA